MSDAVETLDRVHPDQTLCEVNVEFIPLKNDMDVFWYSDATVTPKIKTGIWS